MRKQNIVGKLAKVFEEVFNQGVCGVCLVQFVTPAVIRSKYYGKRKDHLRRGRTVLVHLLKRKHPVSPLSSSEGDMQTVTTIERKKGQQLCFENDLQIHPLPLKIPSPLVSATHAKEKKTTSTVSTQTSLQSLSTKKKLPGGLRTELR